MVAGGGSGLFNEGLDAAAVAAAVSTVSFSQVSVTIVEFFGILCVLLNIFVTRLVKDPPIHAGAHKESVKEQARCSFYTSYSIHFMQATAQHFFGHITSSSRLQTWMIFTALHHEHL